MTELERTLGYTFEDPSLLQTALTHTSYANEHRREGTVHNERLEFLGDAVLELISSEYLYKKFPDMVEGEMTKKRASMVCEPSLAKCARSLELSKYLRLGHGEEQMGGREKDSITSDAMEAVIGAVFLDGGFEEAKKIVLGHILLDLREEDLFKDKKTILQELAQEQGKTVTYVLTGESGPAHQKEFRVDAVIDGRVLGSGAGRTKKAAAQAAAEEAIRVFGRR